MANFFRLPSLESPARPALGRGHSRTLSNVSTDG
jgi:hypothetical protein